MLDGVLVKRHTVSRPTFMRRTRAQCISDHIAARIIRRTKKHFSSLHDEALREINNMANSPSSTSTSMNVADTPASRTAIGREIPDSPAALAAASPARLTAEPSKDSINSGLTCGSQIPMITVKETDSTVITGSHKGAPSERRTVSTDEFKTQGGPRSQVGQFPLSGKQASTPAAPSFTGAEGSDQN